MYVQSLENNGRIENRNGETVSEITLQRGDWCRFTSKRGVAYIITNVNGKLTVTKPCDICPLPVTNEIKAAPIYIVGLENKLAPKKRKKLTEK